MKHFKELFVAIFKIIKIISQLFYKLLKNIWVWMFIIFVVGFSSGSLTNLSIFYSKIPLEYMPYLEIFFNTTIVMSQYFMVMLLNIISSIVDYLPYITILITIIGYFLYYNLALKRDYKSKILERKINAYEDILINLKNIYLVEKKEKSQYIIKVQDSIIKLSIFADIEVIEGIKDFKEKLIKLSNKKQNDIVNNVDINKDIGKAYQKLVNILRNSLNIKENLGDLKFGNWFSDDFLKD
jgi:hypothetical protein